MSLSTSITGPLRMGSRGTSVSTLQAALNTALQPSHNLETDGIFGRRTEQAVRAFQQRRALGVDGVVGSKTADALGLGYTAGAGGGGATPAPPPPGRPPAPGSRLPTFAYPAARRAACPGATPWFCEPERRQRDRGGHHRRHATGGLGPAVVDRLRLRAPGGV